MNFAEMPPAVAEPADPASPEPLPHESEETDQTRPTKGRTLALALVIVGCLLLVLSVSIGLFAVLDSKRAEGHPLALTLIIGGCLLLVVSVLIGLFAALNPHRTRRRTLALALITVGGLLLLLVPVGFLFPLIGFEVVGLALGGLLCLLTIAVPLAVMALIPVLLYRLSWSACRQSWRRTYREMKDYEDWILSLPPAERLRAHRTCPRQSRNRTD
jgi:hypothetical protein